MTQADIDAIDTAIQSFGVAGIATVSVGGQTTTMKSLDELLRYRAWAADQFTKSEDRTGIGIRQMVPGGCG